MKPISIPEAAVRFFSTGAAGAEKASMPLMRYSADVKAAEDPKDGRQRVGLCFDCLHSQVIQSPRGSTFYRCQLSDTDPSFPKYPRLPVLRCAGYIRKL
jgi:hypothetical protein